MMTRVDCRRCLRGRTLAAGAGFADGAGDERVVAVVCGDFTEGYRSLKLASGGEPTAAGSSSRRAAAD